MPVAVAEPTVVDPLDTAVPRAMRAATDTPAPADPLDTALPSALTLPLGPGNAQLGGPPPASIPDFQRQTHELAARLPYAATRGVISGAAGLPGNILNLGLAALGKHLPIGSPEISAVLDALAKHVGYTPPEPGSIAASGEQVAQTLGEFMGPGMAVQLAKAFGIAPTAFARYVGLKPETLESFLTAGPAQDVGMATSAAVGEQVARGLGIAPEAGKIAGPLTVAAVHGGASAGITTAGKSVTKTDALRAAEAELERATHALETARVTTGADVEAATTALADAKAAYASTFTDLPDAFPAGPVPPDTGAAMQRTAAEVSQAKRMQLGQAAETLRSDVGPVLDRMQVAEKSQQWASVIFDKWKDTKSKLFNATEAITGDEPVMLLENLHSRIGPLTEETAQTGQGLPRGTRAMAEAGTEAMPGTEAQARVAAGQVIGQGINPQALSFQQMTDLFNDPGFLAGLTPKQQGIVAQYLQAGRTEAEVPFWLARRMESALSDMAYGHAKPIGTLSQGIARQMYEGLQQDFKRFFSETAEGQQIDPMLRQAKDTYIEGIRLYNQSIVGKLLDKSPGSREAFLMRLVRGTSNEELGLIKKNADPDTWAMLKSHVLGEMYAKVTVNGQLDPKRLAALQQRLTNTGQLDLLLTPVEQQRFTDLMRAMGGFSTGAHQKLAADLAKLTPDKVVESVFKPGDVGRTALYQQLTPAPQFDAAVKAWTEGFVTRLQDMAPDQVQRELLPLTRTSGPGGKSQAEIMFAGYPGVADRLTQARDAYRQGGRTIQALEAPLAQAKSTAARTVAQGRTDLDAARQALVDARKAANAEGDLSIRGFHRMLPGMYVRGGVDSIGLMTALEGVLHMDPARIGTGLAIAGGMEGFQLAARSPAVRQAVKTFQPTPYGPAASRFAAQVLGGATAPEVESPVP